MLLRRIPVHRADGPCVNLNALSRRISSVSKCARRIAVLACLLVSHNGLSSGLAEETPPPSRDRYKPNLAGNEEVERIIRSFDGRGEVGDESQPTPASEAVEQFRLAEGLKIELVSAEPEVMQPLFMHFDQRGRLWVVEYRQYPFPEGLKVVRYDQHLRAVFDKVPQPPPHHVRGKDRVAMFSDTDGDGRYDTKRVVIDGLNIASSVVTGHGGIWVLNPPYLLFYPDADGDDVPDSDPEVRLAGFGLEDTHSVTNSMRWGPDGWLYAANGSTTTATISSQATKNVHWEGQCIWRYHPDRDLFEIYAEGGGNTFSTEIDSRGRVFSGTNHGSTRGMFYPQGSYGSKNWGKHGPLTNPFAFGFFEHMRHEGDPVRFAQTFVIYEGGSLPRRYQGNVIAANALHNRVWASQMLVDGSTYRTIDQPNVCETDDRWFRPVDVKVGPDGAVYLADWYDTRLTHVDPRDNWHKTSGRIYRIQAQDHVAKPLNIDFGTLSDKQLIAQFYDDNKWKRQTAVRVLAERLRSPETRDPGATLDRLRTLVREETPEALEALWTLHGAGAFDFQLAADLLSHRDADVRRWAVRLLGDSRELTEELAAELTALAAREAYVQVRSQLASSAKRFATRHALPIILQLLRRDEDQADLHLPLLLWWALEAHSVDQPAGLPHIAVKLATEDDISPRERLLQMFEDRAVWDIPGMQETILSRLMKRWAMEGLQSKDQTQDAGLLACSRLLTLSPSAEHTQKLMAGFLEAYQGREITKLPESLRDSIDSYQKSLAESDLTLGLRLGDEDAVNTALATVKNKNADLPARLALISTLGEVDQPRAVSPLLSLLGSGESSAIKRATMESLMSYPHPEIGATICSRYQTTLPNEHGLRETAHRVLASRATWTKQFLAEINTFRIEKETVALDVVQQMRLHPDSEIQKLLDKHWGKTRAASEDKLAEMERIRNLLRGPHEASPRDGYALFKEHCATCHTLFDEGGRTGPNLTGYERTNIEFLLLAMVDPSAAIREEFTQYQVVTLDGRILTGLIDEQTPTTVSLRGANNQVTLLNRDDIDILQAMETSIMPDNLTAKLTPQQIHDLFAYVMSPTPVVTPAQAGE